MICAVDGGGRARDSLGALAASLLCLPCLLFAHPKQMLALPAVWLLLVVVVVVSKGHFGLDFLSVFGKML